MKGFAPYLYPVCELRELLRDVLGEMREALATSSCAR